MAKGSGRGKEPAAVRCGFCQEPFGPGRKRSEEHLLGDGILRRLGLDKVEIEMNVHDGLTDTVYPATRRTVVGNAVARRVFCEPCNNGWMSRLEESVIDIVRSLVEGRTHVEDFSPLERASLARWMLKTGLAIYNAKGMGGAPPLPSELYEAVYRSSWPRGATAFVTRLPMDCGAYPALNCTFAYFNGRQDGEFWRSPSTGMAAGAVYRDLMIGVAYMDPRSERVGLVRGIHHPFWTSDHEPAMVDTFFPLRHPVRVSFFDAAVAAVCAVENGTPPEAIASDFYPSPFATKEENTEWLRLFESLKAANAA